MLLTFFICKLLFLRGKLFIIEYSLGLADVMVKLSFVTSRINGIITVLHAYKHPEA